MIKISKRLEKVASYVKKNDVLLDVGTDHGLLPMYLVEKKIINEAIASDVVEKIIDKTSKAVKENGFDKNIKVVLSDGLKNINDKNVTVITIAGMGGILISDILKNKKKYLKGKRLILSPHRDSDVVRKTLHELNFKIVDEDVLLDKNDKFYNFIIATEGIDSKYTANDYKLGKKLINKKTKNVELVKYLKYLISKNETILKKISKSQSAQDKVNEIKKENEMLNKYLKKELNKENK